MNVCTTTRTSRCDGCLHWKPLWYIGGTHEEPTRACLYILDTGHRRGGSAENCTKKTISGRANV